MDKIQRLNNGVRTVYADLHDLVEMSNEPKCEMDDQFFYSQVGALGEQPLYFRWSRQMDLVAPGELNEAAFGSFDYRHVLSGMLQKHMDIPSEINQCMLKLFFGRMVEDDFHVEPERGIIFAIEPLEQAVQTLVLLQWPEGQEPVYDRSLEGELARSLGATMIAQVMPDEKNEGVGCDVLFLTSPRYLGDEFFAAQQEYDRLGQFEAEMEWRQFDLRRAYYREKIRERGQMLPEWLVTVEYDDDYVTVTIAHAESLPAELCNDGDPSIRIWYSEQGLSTLNRVMDKMSSLVFGRMLGSLLGGSLSFGQA